MEPLPTHHALLARPSSVRLTRGGFKTVELNAHGWSALIGAGLALGAVVVLSTRVPPLVALPTSVLVAWLALLGLDHFRWRNSSVAQGRGDLDPATGELIVDELRRRGITATFREAIYEDDDDASPHCSIVCREADAKTVGKLLDQYVE